jgi:hypothetical protein
MTADEKPSARHDPLLLLRSTEVSSILEQRIRGVQEEAGLAETGRVLSVGCVNNLWLLRGRGTLRIYPLGRLLS